MLLSAKAELKNKNKKNLKCTSVKTHNYLHVSMYEFSHNSKGRNSSRGSQLGTRRSVAANVSTFSNACEGPPQAVAD